MNIIELLLKTFENLVTNFSWRRLFHVLLVIGLLYGCLLVYDNFTGTFTLGRLQRATELLSKLYDMETSSGTASPELSAVHNDIRARLMAELGVAVGVPTASETLRFWLKFLMAGLPWGFIAFFVVRDTHRKGENLQNMLIGIMAILLVFAAIGGIIPTVWWPWFNLFVYPFLQFIIIVVPIAIPSFVKARDTAKQKQEEANNTIESVEE